ncbi:para-aminobenzoate synthetase component 1 [Knoellia remsis]|uniref:Para-aminobenzoate synthetase component 1 n=1 Tax=Knoellia remsis TaxID=407159 RepID=A0A2T0U9T8_9MICO|nr:chorismate-binding protein [Knoellia remsis]PRY54705.1 para-aminobenzoate synthetase component 1 [Knoellia remsis]
MAWARFGSLDGVAIEATGVEAITHDIADVTAGFWGVVLTFEGELTAVRFTDVDRDPGPMVPASWPGVTGEWARSLDDTAYRSGVGEIRERIARGTVYQVNLCTVLEAPVGPDASVRALGAVLAEGNPAPYAAVLDVPEAGLEIACASPESYLERHGSRVTSRPIKGTAVAPDALLEKDFAENVMIVDLVRNDLAHVCRPGTVSVDHLFRVEQHPGLVQLVSDVSGELRDGVGWRDLLDASFPPGSVSGAPKHTALQAISDLEPVPRGPYCGAIGWIDADRDEARLAVGIRTFWVLRDESGAGVLRFGAGAGITWGSDPDGEVAEVHLKARRLVELARTAYEPVILRDEPRTTPG